jgi:hypothetical protein
LTWASLTLMASSERSSVLNDFAATDGSRTSQRNANSTVVLTVVVIMVALLEDPLDSFHSVEGSVV